MTKKTMAQATPKARLPARSDLPVSADNAERPASNASKPLDKPRDRIKAHIDQATIQDVGPNALPVSDYPLKKGPLAANTLDIQERKRVKRG